jgi:hypothetical protein
MPQYMMSFNSGDMKFPDFELPQVAAEVRVVREKAIAAGVWIFGGGFMGHETEVVGQDGKVRPGPLAMSDVHLGGFSILEVEKDEDIYQWAHEFAIACRCDQELRKFMDAKWPETKERYLLLVIDEPNNWATESEMESIGIFNKELRDKNYWIAGTGIASHGNATTIDNRNGVDLVTSGSMITGVDNYSGFWLLALPKDVDVVELSKRASLACNRRVEIRRYL